MPLQVTGTHGVWEFGAGTGALALQLLDSLLAQGRLRGNRRNRVALRHMALQRHSIASGIAVYQHRHMRRLRPVWAGNDQRSEVARLDKGGQFRCIVHTKGGGCVHRLLVCAELVVSGPVHQA